MVKKSLILSALFAFTTFAFAYNPPSSGEEMLNYTQPNLISGSGSASGGALYTVIPSAIIINPAVTGFSQRNVLDVSYTGLIETDENTESVYGQGFQLGLSIPSKWCVSTVTVNGIFSGIENMNWGNSITVHGGVAKDLTEKLAVGINIYSGFYFLNNFDFTVGADLGFLYKLGRKSIFKDARLGVSLLNLGKTLLDYDVKGIDGTKNGVSYPGICTLRASFGAELFSTDIFKGGFSADLYFPTFQNVIFDTEFSVLIKDIVKVSTSWQANLREILNGVPLKFPSVGVAVSFSIDTGKILADYAEWSKSEISTSGTWQMINGNVHAASAGCILNLGMPDTTPPQIILWDEEE